MKETRFSISCEHGSHGACPGAYMIGLCQVGCYCACHKPTLTIDGPLFASSKVTNDTTPEVPRDAA
jgi:hypothetical protein